MYFSNPLEFCYVFDLDPAMESNMKVDFEKFDGKKKFHVKSSGIKFFGSSRSRSGIGGEA